MNYYEIGQRIRKARKAQNISQEELAERVGISTTHMSHIETGNTKLSLPVLVNISTSLEVSTDSLLFEESKPSRSNLLNSITSTLESCTTTQLKIAEEMIKALKTSLNKYL